jgi:replicative DNA helicase
MMQGKPAIDRREVELCVLGAAALDEEAAAFIVRELEPAAFSDSLLRRMFEVFRDGLRDGLPLNDPAILADRLIMGGCAPAAAGAAVAEALESVPHAAHARWYVERLHGLVKRDRVRLLGERLQGSAHDPTTDSDELISEALRILNGLQSGKAGNELIDAAAALRQFDERGDLPAIASGLTDLDSKLVGGLRPGQLVIIAGRPGAGKSCLLAQVILNVAESKRPGILCSLEMCPGELAGRALQKIERDRFQALPVWFAESSELHRIQGQIRAAVRMHGAELAAVDYLGLIESPRERNANRVEQVAAVTRSFKLLARELQIPILLGCQLNRETEKRGRPQLSDLRESGAIEQDADIVILINCPAGEQDSARELIVAKHRGGPCGKVEAIFNGPMFSFSAEALDHSWCDSLCSNTAAGE